MGNIILNVLATICCLGVFFIWGSVFLGWIRSKRSFCENVLFGYIVMQAFYQVVYLPFFLARGSYRWLTILWLVFFAVTTAFCLGYIARQIRWTRKKRSAKPLILGTMGVIVFISWLALRIGIHPRPFGADTNTYIDAMNKMVYQDIIWQRAGELYFHSGLNSHFGFFATLSMITGIHPYYVAHYFMRFIGVALTSMVAYRTGKVLLDRSNDGISGYGLALSVLVPLGLAFWSSIYTGYFFWMRTNEAKAYCQMILLPLAFSVCAETFLEDGERSVLWKKQMAIGLAAVPIATSSMTAYLLLIALNMIGLIARDRIRDIRPTVLRAIMCMLPNLCYLLLYIIL